MVQPPPLSACVCLNVWTSSHSLAGGVRAIMTAEAKAAVKKVLNQHPRDPVLLMHGRALLWRIALRPSPFLGLREAWVGHPVEPIGRGVGVSWNWSPDPPESLLQRTESGQEPLPRVSVRIGLVQGPLLRRVSPWGSRGRPPRDHPQVQDHPLPPPPFPTRKCFELEGN